MSLFSDNVIPGNHGKVFGTNAKSHQEVLKIVDAISHIEGIKDVIADEEKYPREFVVHTHKLVAVRDIEKAVIKAGFHSTPKALFQL